MAIRTAWTLSADGSKLYAAQDNQDQVAVIDTASNKVIGKIGHARSGQSGIFPEHNGAAPTAVTINRRRNRFMQFNAGSNSIAVIPLSGPHAFQNDRPYPDGVRPDRCCLQCGQ